MTKPNSIQNLIEAWPTISAFADEIGCGYEAARAMRRRNSIAPEHWQSVVEASRKRGISGIDFGWLASQRISLPPREAVNG